MAVKVPYTTPYDFVLIMAKFASIGLWMSFFGFLIKGSGLGDISFADNQFLKFSTIIVFLVVFVFVSVLAHSITTLPIINTISSYIYVRVNLKTDMSFSEVSKIKELFVPNGTGTWHPCTEVTELPPNQRAEYIRQVYRKEFNV